MNIVTGGGSMERETSVEKTMDAAQDTGSRAASLGEIRGMVPRSVDWLSTLNAGQRAELLLKPEQHSAKSVGGRLQLNKRAPYVCGFAWSDMVHGWMVYTERAEMVAVSCGTSHASAISMPLWWIFKNAL